MARGPRRATFLAWAVALALGACAAACGAEALGTAEILPAGPDEAGVLEASLPDTSRADGACNPARYCGCTKDSGALCADFDGTNLLEGWDEKTVNGPAELAAAPSPVSAPNALRTTALSTDGGATAKVATLSKTITGDVAKMVLELDLATLPCGSSPSYLVDVSARGMTGQVVGEIALFLNGGGLNLYVPGATPNETVAVATLDAMGTRTWFKLGVRTGGGMVSVVVDGQTTAVVPLTFTSTSFVLTLGMNSLSAGPKCEALYDNVVLRLD